MLTRSRLRRGEWKLEEINPKIEKRKVSQNMASSNEGEAPETKSKDQFQ